MSTQSTPSTAVRFRRKLAAWYRKAARDLPWRRTRDPYAVLVSEFMLQQTQVARVLEYYEPFLARYPTVRRLARARPATVREAWDGLGYYRRAADLHRLAREVVARHGGEIPREVEELRRLPGVGAYTAGAVSTFAFERPAAAVDTNVARVLGRVFRGRDGVKGAAGAKAATQLAEELQPRRGGAAWTFNQALMELGALVCRPKNPVCLRCPIEADCAAFAAGEQEIIPSPRERLMRRITAVVGVIMENGRVLIQRRPETGLLGGLWEFPGGKVKRGETLRAALARELREELGAAPIWSLPLMTVDHSYTQFRVTLHAFRCALAAEPKRDPKNRRWVRLSALHAYPFPSGSAKIVERLLTDAGSPAPPASGTPAPTPAAAPTATAPRWSVPAAG